MFDPSSFRTFHTLLGRQIAAILAPLHQGAAVGADAVAQRLREAAGAAGWSLRRNSLAPGGPVI